jgi:thiosulfate/3-mercaptopyruvate sulfurtransferase
MKTKNLITAAEFIAMRGDASLVIADCRFDIADPALGRRQYDEGHIPGAVHVSLNDHLSAPVGPRGGRHPLPSIARLAEVMGAFGIERNVSTVVCYDDSGNCYAARLWWILRYLGHDRVRVLNGGLKAYIAAGGTLTREAASRHETVFTSAPRERMLATQEEVRSRRGDIRLIDSRAADRYSGENETVDPVAGHIPGALNLPWQDCLDEHNTLKPKEILDTRFQDLDAETVFYCGSGVTACVNLLAMEESGRALPRLYAGGWSDWITSEE